jgi:hypothetical protein
MTSPFVMDVDGTLTSEHYTDTNLTSLRENPVMMLLAISLQDKHPLLISTARPERYRSETETWLVKHGLNPEHIYMRSSERENDDDHAVKFEHLAHILENYGKPLVWCDDNDENCAMLEKQGVPVIHVKQ